MTYFKFRRYEAFLLSSLLLPLLLSSVLPAGQAYAQTHTQAASSQGSGRADAFTRDPDITAANPCGYPFTPESYGPANPVPLTEPLSDGTVVRFNASFTDSSPGVGALYIYDKNYPIGTSPSVDVYKGQSVTDATLTAHGNGDDILACLRGLFSKQAKGTVTITAGPSLISAMDAQHKAALNTWAMDVKSVSQVWDTASKLAPPYVGDVYKLVSKIFAKRAAELQMAAQNDPPDPSYKIIAQPVLSPENHVTAGYGLTQNEADAINALDDNLSYAGGYVTALTTSITRAHDALQANDAMGQFNQLQAARQYAGQAASLLEAEPTLFANVQNAVEGSGRPRIDLGGGLSFPQVLTYPPYIRDLLGAAQALAQFAAAQ